MHWNETRVVVTGGAGFLGQVVCDLLKERGAAHIDVPRSREYDLTTQRGVASMYDDFRPDVVLHLAAEVGGIAAQRLHPGRYFYANMAMGMHLIEEARVRGLRKFVHVGTVCSYPKWTPIPFQEEDLWSGYPEENNAPYGVAKKSLFVMLDAYQREYGLGGCIAIPVNLYGPRDNFDLQTSHVIPALIRKCVEAREAEAAVVDCWGSGEASREFLYVDDAAHGILAVAERMDVPIPINLGSGREITIKDLAEKIAELVGFDGTFNWDTNQPDGQPRRSLDSTRARDLLDWEPVMPFEKGLQHTIDWYRGQRRKAVA